MTTPDLHSLLQTVLESSKRSQEHLERLSVRLSTLHDDVQHLQRTLAKRRLQRHESTDTLESLVQDMQKRLADYYEQLQRPIKQSDLARLFGRRTRGLGLRFIDVFKQLPDAYAFPSATGSNLILPESAWHRAGPAKHEYWRGINPREFDREHLRQAKVVDDTMRRWRNEEFERTKGVPGAQNAPSDQSAQDLHELAADPFGIASGPITEEKPVVVHEHPGDGVTEALAAQKDEKEPA